MCFQRSGAWGCSDCGWIRAYDGGQFASNQTTVGDKYLISALWATGMITGLNTDVIPENQAERAFAIVVHIIAAFTMACTRRSH